MQIELSDEEARGLFTLLYGGTTTKTLRTLGIYHLMRVLQEEVAPLDSLYFETIASYED